MSRPLCSVVMSTFNRAHLLARSLEGYARHSFDNRELELVIVDDGSEDLTSELVKGWSHASGIAAMVLTPHPKKEAWRDCAATINMGIRASQGKHIILTHPEVIPGITSVAKCVENLELFEERRHKIVGTPGLYACCRVYYLSPRDQELLDTVNWREKGNLAVREIPGFYQQDDNGNPDFTHHATDSVTKPGYKHSTWESWVFGGHSRETWKKLGGMLRTEKWGSCDVGWMARRRALNIPNYTCPDDSSIVIHQDHSDLSIPTPRIMEVWMKELESFPLSNPEQMVYPAIDELGWG